MSGKAAPGGGSGESASLSEGDGDGDGDEEYGPILKNICEING